MHPFTVNPNSTLLPFRPKVKFNRWKLLLLTSFFFNAVLDIDPPQYKAEKGLLDLRTADLAKENVSLSGEWGFYWKTLLEKTPNASPPVYIDFPIRFDQTKINGVTLPSFGFATYSLTILLPKNKKKLALELPDTYTSYRLIVNNEELAAAGHPDSTKEKAIPKWLSKTVAISSNDDTLHLLLQVANFWHAKGGPYKNIILGDLNKLVTEREDSTALDLTLTGCLLMGGLFILGLYLFGKHDQVLLYFSLFCFMYSYRIIGSGFYVFHSLFPSIPWIITIHFEYLTLFLSALFFGLYTLKLYPEDTNRNFILIGIWMCVAFSAIVVLFPPVLFTQLINPFIFYMCGFMSYTFFVYIKATRNNRIGAKYALMSTGVLLIVFFTIILQYFAIISPIKGVLFIGYIGFFFLQSLILSFRFAHTLQLAKKEAEEGLRAKNEFLSTMSHEIRTPLNSVLGLTHLILRNKPREDQQEQLNVLLYSANNLLSIVNDILDYNKIEAGKIHFEVIEFDLAKLAKDITAGLRIIAEDKGVGLFVKIDPALQYHIMGDPTRTGQVISNLVNNAIKFTPAGKVLLEILVDEETESEITVTIRIEDTGIGIAPEKQKLIFEEFTQADTSTSRNFGGTGLGLAICKKILSLQGTVLQLTSEPGKGSVFYFTQSFVKVLGKKEITLATVDMIPAEDSRPLMGVCILLVEDNEINIMVAKTFLEKWGADIDLAINGQEALNLVDEQKHTMILMDLHMPVMDGYEATRLMRERGIKMPIVALTASLPKEIENKIKGTGFNEVVVKPFVPEDLYRVLLYFTGIYQNTGNK